MSTTTDLPLELEDVAQIIAILDGSPYQRLEIATDRLTLKLARGEDGGWTQQWHHQGETAPAANAAAPSPAGNTAATATAQEEEEADDGLAVIRPPLPGTFYRAPQPGAPPFVEIGSRVEPETVVAIVETMKLMNPVHAGVSGEIAAILPANGEMIDADAVLMRVRADS